MFIGHSASRSTSSLPCVLLVAMLTEQSQNRNSHQTLHPELIGWLSVPTLEVLAPPFVESMKVYYMTFDNITFYLARNLDIFLDNSQLNNLESNHLLSF